MKIKYCLLALITALLLQCPSYADSYKDGISSFNRGDYIRAEGYFKSALFSQPNNSSVRYYYATSLFNNRKLAKAKSEFSYIMSNNPNTEAANKSVEFLNYINGVSNYKNSITKAEINIANHHNIMIVNNVLFNDQSSCNLILDTGATYTVISHAMASKLGLDTKNAPMVKIYTANGTVVVPKIRVASIEVGGLVAKDVEVLVQNLGDVEASGLLGLSFLNKFKVTINKKAGKLILEKN